MNNNEEDHVIFRLISLLFVALVIIIIYFDISRKYIQQSIELFTVDSPIFFPFLLVLTLFICFIFELRTEIKEILNIFNYYGKKDTIKQNQNIQKTKEILNLFVFTTVSLIYVYILPILHFIFATSLYMFCIMFVVNESDKIIFRFVKSLLATGVTIPIIYYIFYGIFNVILP